MKWIKAIFAFLNGLNEFRMEDSEQTHYQNQSLTAAHRNGEKLAHVLTNHRYD